MKKITLILCLIALLCIFSACNGGDTVVYDSNDAIFKLSMADSLEMYQTFTFYEKDSTKYSAFGEFIASYTEIKSTVTDDDKVIYVLNPLPEYDIWEVSRKEQEFSIYTDAEDNVALVSEKMQLFDERLGDYEFNGEFGYVPYHVDIKALFVPVTNVTTYGISVKFGKDKDSDGFNYVNVYSGEVCVGTIYYQATELVKENIEMWLTQYVKTNLFIY